MAGQLILIGILTLINAFFAASEMALISIDNFKMKKLADEGDKRATKLLKLVEEPNKFLATIQVGITLAGFFSSASAATGMAVGMSQVLDNIGIPYSEQLSVIFITIILSYFILVFGELFPKRIAMKNADGIALFAVGPISVIAVVAKPFVSLLSLSVNLLMKLFKMGGDESEEQVTEEEIRAMITMARAGGNIKSEQANRIDRIFEFDDIKIKDVMKPKEQVFMVDVDDATGKNIDLIMDKMLSRVPVYKGSNSNVVGILLLKDLFRAGMGDGLDYDAVRDVKSLEESFTWHYDHGGSNLIQSVMWKPTYINENRTINQLFYILQKAKKHMAIVVDDRGQFVGIATLEDLIEEIFGEIEDEFDQLI